ncbi:MAG: cytochrome c maturation protein CcmE [Paracoccaceae bacterium]
MKSLKKTRRIQVIIAAFVTLVLATGLIGYGMKDGINLYRSPTQVLEDPPQANEIFKIGGLVKEGSRTPVVGVHFNFVVTDTNVDILVSYVGNDPAPDLFSEGQGTVATGKYVDGVFLATKILAKHDENYMPKEVIDTLKEQGVYQEPNG